MKDQTNYLERAQEVLGSSHAWRAAHEAMEGVNLTMTYGSGWAKLAQGRHGGAAVRRLRPVTRTGSADIRVSLNKIREKCQEIESRLKPRLIDLRVDPARNTRDDQITAKVGKRRMELYLEPKVPLRKLRRAVERMVVLGSVIVRRTISRRGRSTFLRDAEGEWRRDKKKRALRLRDFDVRWQVGLPHEFCRDPALAHSVDFDGEDAIGHEKPMTTDEVYRTFGVKIQTRMTIGRLMEFNSLLHRWSQGAIGSAKLSTAKSKRPAVMVSDWFFRDPRSPEWTKYMVCFRDTANEDNPGLQVLQPAGPNPYHELPFHHMFYSDVGCAWGMGIPARLHHHQLAYDITFTMLLRTVMTLSGNQIIVNTDALVDKVEDVLDRRLDHVYKISGDYRAADAIARMPTPQVDQNVMAIMQMIPQWFDDAALMSPVMRGVTSKRGESDRAVKTKVEQAETPLVTITDELELVTDDLLTGTLIDLGRNERMSRLRKLLRSEVDERELAVYRSAFKGHDKPIGGVFVSRDSIRPRHPRESRQELQEAIDVGMIEGQEARWAHGIRTGDWMIPSEGDAYRKQMQEIQAILQGRAVRVATGQNHPLHMRVVDDYTEQSVWDLLSDKQQQAIEDHREEHYDVLRIRDMDQAGAQGETGVEQPPEMMMGMPGAEGLGQQPIPFPEQQASLPVPAGPGALPMQPGAPVAGPAELMTAM